MIHEKEAWEVFHGKNLDRVVDKAHYDTPDGYLVKSVDVKFLNGEYVVTVIIRREEE